MSLLNYFSRKPESKLPPAPPATREEEKRPAVLDLLQDLKRRRLSAPSPLQTREYVLFGSSGVAPVTPAGHVDRRVSAPPATVKPALGLSISSRKKKNTDSPEANVEQVAPLEVDQSGYESLPTTAPSTEIVETVPAPSSSQDSNGRRSSIVTKNRRLLDKNAVAADAMAATALKHFGIKKLTAFQIEAVTAALSGRDSLIIVPTGGGKSLCFQLPSLMAGTKFVLVISPLVSLMQDQVNALTQKNIPAISTSGCRNKALLWKNLKKGTYRLLYASPESIKTHLAEFKKLKSSILLIAIDECHCVSEWGHSFRPSYRELGNIRTWAAGIPVMCATATATSAVQADIARVFKLLPSKTLTLKGSVNRPNIFYRQMQRPSSLHETFRAIFDLPPIGDKTAIMRRLSKPVDNSSVNPYSSTIVYVSTKSDSRRLCESLLRFGVTANCYNADMSGNDRAEAHQGFMNDETQVLVATVAYGMGINKQDIRRVVHNCLPTSVEAYSQQSGRAGRDGLPAEAILIWNTGDVTKTQQVIHGSNEPMSASYRERLSELFDKMVGYVESKQCRRKYLIEYFGETAVTENGAMSGVCRQITTKDGQTVISCSACDYCTGDVLQGTSQVTGNDLFDPNKLIDLTKEALLMLKVIWAKNGKAGAILPCKVLVGSKSQDVTSKGLDKSPNFGKGAYLPLQWWKEFVRVLEKRKLLRQTLTGFGGRGSNAQGSNKFFALSLTAEGKDLLFQKTLEFSVSPSDLNETLATGWDKHQRKINGGRQHRVKAPGAPTKLTSALDIKQHACEQLKAAIVAERKAEAERRGCAPFMVVNMPLIETIVAIRPTSMASLEKNSVTMPEHLANSEFMGRLMDVVKTKCEELLLETDLGIGPSKDDGRTTVLGDVVEEEWDMQETAFQDFDEFHFRDVQ